MLSSDSTPSPIFHMYELISSTSKIYSASKKINQIILFLFIFLYKLANVNLLVIIDTFILFNLY